MEFIAAKCPNCAGELRVPDDRTTVVCMYCGVEVLINQSKGPKGDNFENLRALAVEAEKSRAFDDAYEYWKRAREVSPSDFDALLGQAVTAELLQGYDVDTLKKTGPSSVVSSLSHYISQAASQEQPNLRKKAAARFSKHKVRWDFVHELDPSNEEALVQLYESARHYAAIYTNSIYPTDHSESNRIEGNSRASENLEKLRKLNPQLALDVEQRVNREVEQEYRSSLSNQPAGGISGETVFVIVGGVVLAIVMTLLCR